MPSHFHSARYAEGIKAAMSVASSGWASMGERNTGAPAGSGRGP